MCHGLQVKVVWFPMNLLFYIYDMMLIKLKSTKIVSLTLIPWSVNFFQVRPMTHMAPDHFHVYN